MRVAPNVVVAFPSAVHLEWLNYVDSKTKEFKPAEELRAMFQKIGVVPEREVITY